MSRHDPARWENRTEAEAKAERRRDAANVQGALQTREIRKMPRREQVLAAQAVEYPEPTMVEIGSDERRYSWRPSRPWHVYELVRTVAACTQVLVGTAILLRVYGAV